MPLADLETFRASTTGSEFAQLSDAEVQDALDKAAESCPDDPWFGFQLEGHTELTAHILSSVPMGNGARLDKADETSIHGARFEKLKAIVGCGTRVI